MALLSCMHAGALCPCLMHSLPCRSQHLQYTSLQLAYLQRATSPRDQTFAHMHDQGMIPAPKLWCIHIQKWLGHKVLGNAVGKQQLCLVVTKALGKDDIKLMSAYTRCTWCAKMYENPRQLVQAHGMKYIPACSQNRDVHGGTAA